MRLSIGRTAFIFGFVLLLLATSCAGNAETPSEAVATQVATPTLEIPTQVVTLEEMLIQTPVPPTVVPEVVATQEAPTQVPATPTATPEAAATSTTVDIFDKPVLEHPNTLEVEFDESVTEKDRRLVEMALKIAESLFENAGFPIVGKVYVAGNKDSYLQFADVLDMTPELAAKYYEGTRGSTDALSARILINIPLHDENYTGTRRDNTLVFTIVHEFYHILQAQLSEGWVAAIWTPPEFRESSANLGAWRALIAYFCKPIPQLDVSATLFKRLPDCSNEFVEESILDYEIATFFIERTAFSEIELYLVANFGVDAYDRFYATLSGTVTSGGELWLQALETAFGASSPNDLFNQARAYIEEHSEEFIQRWEDLNARP